MLNFEANTLSRNELGKLASDLDKLQVYFEKLWNLAGPNLQVKLCHAALSVKATKACIVDLAIAVVGHEKDCLLIAVEPDNVESSLKWSPD